MQSEFRRSRKRDPPLLADSIGETLHMHLPAVTEDKENSDSWNLRKQEPDGIVMLRLRRETAKQLQDMAAEHQRSLKALEQVPHFLSSRSMIKKCRHYRPPSRSS